MSQKKQTLGRKRDDNPKDETPTREEAQAPSRPDVRIPMFKGAGNSRLGVYARFIKPDHRGYFFAEGERREGRRQRAIDAWWTPVCDDDGKQITYKSGSDMLYLMEIPEKYAEQDRLLKQEKVRARLEQEAEIQTNEYSPNNEELAVKSEISDRPM